LTTTALESPRQGDFAWLATIDEDFDMPNTNPIRTLLLVDAATCAAMGALLVPYADLLNRWTHRPEPLLFYAGLSLFPIALFMVVAALRRPLMRWAVHITIAGNVLWVIGSAALLLGLIPVNSYGAAFILFQALAVALLAWLEHVQLRSAIASGA
jgi:hypothetical protein